MTTFQQAIKVHALGLFVLLTACGDSGANPEGETGSETESSTSGDGDGDGNGDGDGDGGDQQCDPIAQDCPEGFKCTAFDSDEDDVWDANKCIPASDSGGVAGDPCSIEGEDMFTGIDDCAEGYICLSVDENLENGACTEFCSAAMDCPNTSGGGGICSVFNDGALLICLTTCEPLLQDCPGQGACYGTDQPPFICFAPDAKGGGQDGQPCNYLNACLEGLNCAPKETQEDCTGMEYGCCTPFCALDGADVCSGTEECVPFFAVEQPGYENIGVCALPA